jgi:hypothetical protein
MAMISDIFSACALIYSILAIELTLQWNDVSDIYAIKNTWEPSITRFYLLLS